MSHDPERRHGQRSALGKPVFIVLVASIVLAGVFLFAMLSLTREEPLTDGVADAPLSDERVTIEENAPPVDRTLLPTPPGNEPLTEQVDVEPTTQDAGAGSQPGSAGADNSTGANSDAAPSSQVQ